MMGAVVVVVAAVNRDLRLALGTGVPVGNAGCFGMREGRRSAKRSRRRKKKNAERGDPPLKPRGLLNM